MNDKNKNFALEVEKTNSKCPIGETVGKTRSRSDPVELCY